VQTDTTIPAFNPFSPDFYGDPGYFDILRRLRNHAPVHRVAQDTLTVARYADIREVSHDPERFCSGRGAMVNDPLRGPEPLNPSRSILFKDPPEHARHRRVISRSFTPRAVGALEDRIRHLACVVLDRVAISEPIDAVQELTAPFPLLVIAELLGIADSDRPSFRRWSDATIEAADHPPEATAEARAELQAFLGDLLEEKRRTPGLDLVSVLLGAQIDDQPLDEGELLSWLLTLLVAGNETTRTLVSGGMHVLWRHPPYRARLAAKPDLIPQAVEEILRWVTPIKTFCRTATCDTDLSGHPVHEGDYLIMLYASGNRDERVFGPTADTFDPFRAQSNAHLAFGFGEHLCLGAALARLEARVFFEELMRRYPDYEVVGEPALVPSTLIAGVKSLPVVLAP
jgi:cytochrome P450